MINTVKMPRAYSEVYYFIEALGENYKNKIPKKFYDLIKNNRDINYNPHITKDMKVEKGMFSHEAVVLISILNLQYWADENEKEELKEIYENNSKPKETIKEIEKSQENIITTNSTENKNEINNSSDMQMIEYSELKWYQKIIFKIKEFFNRNKNI